MAEKSNGPTASAVGHEFVITRVFDAPRDLVFAAWTDPAHLAHWWGPPGCSIEIAKFELRPGGVFHYSARTPNGQLMWGLFMYREIITPEKLVFVNSFSDEVGGLTRNPWLPTWPLEVLNTILFSAEGSKTTITLSATPINATEEERNIFGEQIKSMQAGFAGTFDKLATYLAGSTE